jgi:hypothetical protein
MIEELFIDCDNLIVRDNVRDEVTGAFLTPDDDDAEATFSLLDEDKAEFGGGTYTDVAMTYVADSEGRWEGTLDEAAPIVEGTIYFIKIHVTASSDRQDTMYLRRIAAYKG